MTTGESFDAAEAAISKSFDALFVLIDGWGAMNTDIGAKLKNGAAAVSRAGLADPAGLDRACRIIASDLQEWAKRVNGLASDVRPHFEAITQRLPVISQFAAARQQSPASTIRNLKRAVASVDDGIGSVVDLRDSVNKMLSHDVPSKSKELQIAKTDTVAALEAFLLQLRTMRAQFARAADEQAN